MARTSAVERLSPSQSEPPHVIRGRKRLVKAAVKLFRSNSYHATSVSDVAREAGVSVGAVYLYIQTKSDLLVLIFNDVVEEYKRRVYRVGELDGTASEKLAAFLREYYSVLDRHHAKTEIMYHEFGAIEPDARGYIRSVEEDLESALAKIMLGGMETGEFAHVDTRLHARNILWLGHLWALNRGGVRSEMSIDDFIVAQTAFILAALRASA